MHYIYFFFSILLHFSKILSISILPFYYLRLLESDLAVFYCIQESSSGRGYTIIGSVKLSYLSKTVVKGRTKKYWLEDFCFI